MGEVYVSTDTGANWTSVEPSSKYWRCVDCDSTGAKAIICANSAGRIYTTTNTGADWTERSPAGDVDKFWGFVACKSNFTLLLAGVRTDGASGGGRLYTSIDGGANWTERQPAGDIDVKWSSGSCSDGNNVIVCAESGNVYTSDDSGATWTVRII
jgi:photosystem II stability/assembly factor-like uncharacterized protein